MELVVFGSGRLPHDLFRSDFWGTSHNERTKSFQSCSLDEHDITNEWNYKFKRKIVVIIKLNFIEIKYVQRFVS